MAVRKFKPVTPGQRNKVISELVLLTTLPAKFLRNLCWLRSRNQADETTRVK